MPYITKARKSEIDGIQEDFPKTCGELNYVLTTTIKDYLGPYPDYHAFNSAIGALECCKLELYRRMIAPYEDKAIERNGDVYP